MLLLKEDGKPQAMYLSSVGIYLLALGYIRQVGAIASYPAYSIARKA
ncbi:hypothetical protein H6F79_20365 [Trichocoleus sp. FACHB-69]|nr:hypothetical protein [Trichocoleus sp. FACHB-69]